MNPSQVVIYSGGAAGTEQFFGAQAEQYGIQEVNFTFEGHMSERSRGMRFLTNEELAMKDVSITYIEKIMDRDYSRAPLFRKVLQSICWQISSGQEIFVVGIIQEDNTVNGGTGWGAEYAKICNKPLFVFDQEKKTWFKWNKDNWIEVKDVQITCTQFTATGTRFLNDDGKKAISELFTRSFAK